MPAPLTAGSHNMSVVSKLDSETEALGHAMSGGLAGMATLLLLYPLDTIKTRAQVRSSSSVARVQTLKDLFGYYDGLGAGLLNSGVNTAVYYYFYSLLKVGLLSKLSDSYQA
jgi:hypothetical protein